MDIKRTGTFMKHITIILAFLMTFGTQVGADQFKCALTVGGTGLFSDLVTGINKTPIFYEEAKCSMQCPEINVVYDNCFVDKMKGVSKVATASVIRSCERIACEPTFFQKLKYK